MLLTFKPNQFFNELEKISRHKEATLRAAYRRAQQQGLIEHKIQQDNNVARLTDKGRRKIVRFTAEQLSSGAILMVIFDIPEDEGAARRKFRQVLKDWQFQQVQKSVWTTDKDYREDLVELIRELELDSYVQLYESARHFPE
jgi:DNA-binding transcriptional regulator PaaX